MSADQSLIVTSHVEAVTIAIQPSAWELRREALETAESVTQVQGETDQLLAVGALTEMRKLLKLVESSRQMVKAPVLVLGQKIDAPTALQWGMVNEVVDDTAALAARMDAIAAQLDGMGTDALRMLKLVLRNGETSPLREQLGVEAVANGLNFQSREFADKKAAYLNKLKAGKK